MGYKRLLESIWGRCGIDLESNRNRFGMVSGSIGDVDSQSIRIYSGSIWNSFGIDLGSIGNQFGIVSRSNLVFWEWIQDRFGVEQPDGPGRPNS